jgi:hypothetical protein
MDNWPGVIEGKLTNLSLGAPENLAYSRERGETPERVSLGVLQILNQRSNCRGQKRCSNPSKSCKT